MDRLWQPGRIGPMELKNRAVRSATNEHLATPKGYLTQRWADTEIELAKHEVGLIISGHFTVDGTQRADEGQPVLDQRAQPEILRYAADGVHQYGGRLVIQISHPGPKVIPGVNQLPARMPDDLSLEEMDTLTQRFVFAAKKAKDCGIDGVQLHLAHGYLLSSFLNPEVNHRQDEYGGSLENRFRLAGRILREMREACGKEFAILVKVDRDASGDLSGLLRLCQQAGVDGAEISGLDVGARPGQKTPFYLEDLRQVRADVTMPLILVGGIFSLETAETVLESGADFAAFSRSLIYQPDFIARMRSGLQTESKCAACGNCYKVYRQRPMRCVFHKEEIPELEAVFGPYGK